VSFTRSLSIKLAPQGIRVNAVAPGLVITALQAGSRPAEEMEGMGVGMPPHERAGQPAELGHLYSWLLQGKCYIAKSCRCPMFWC
jgi:NAD(P)-dependent dehydrogenase (short-subunit alcohol dehydrogenase family)